MIDQHIWKLENIEQIKYDFSTVSASDLLTDHSLLILIKGEGTIEMDQQLYRCDHKKGKALFCNPMTEIRYAQDHPQQSLMLYRITMGIYDKTHTNDTTMYEKRNGQWLPNGEWGSRHYYRIRDLAESMEQLKRENAAGNGFKIQMLFYECLDLLSKDWGHPVPDEPGNMIRQTAAYIQEHYDEDINRDQLAEMAGINKAYFSRLFRKEMGCSFSEYLRATRIKKAQEYLLTSKASIREIAHKVGYKNEFYLSQKFKQATGFPPSLYIKKPKKIASVSSNYTACLLAWGITPVIAKINPFIESLFQDQIHTHRVQTIDLLSFQYNRMIADASPDLIICYDTYEQLDELKRIAPTCSVSLFRHNWREQLKEISSIVNAERKAEEWLARYDEKADKARRTLAGVINEQATVGIYEIWKDKIMVFGDSYGRGGHVIYQHLKLSPTATIRKEVAERGYKVIRLEELPQYAADYMFITVFHAKDGQAYASQIMKSPIWMDLPAVRNKRVYFNEHGVFYNWDPASTEVQLNTVVRQLMS